MKEQASPATTAHDVLRFMFPVAPSSSFFGFSRSNDDDGVGEGNSYGGDGDDVLDVTGEARLLIVYSVLRVGRCGRRMEERGRTALWRGRGWRK